MAASMFNVKSPKILINLTHTCKFLPRVLRNPRHVRYSSSKTLENDTHLEIIDEEQVDQVKNFSNLPPRLYDRYHGYVPEESYFEEKTFSDFIERKDFLKQIYATYGEESGVDPRICWPSKEELQLLKEDEKDWEVSFQELMANLKKEKEEEAEYRKNLQEKVEKNMANMDKWIQAFEDKKRKELQKEEEYLEKQKTLLDEAEEHYGYPVNANSEEFQSFVQEKKEAEKRALKELKKKQKKALLSARLQAVVQQ